MSSAGCRQLLPSNYCKHVYFVFILCFASIFILFSAASADFAELRSVTAGDWRGLARRSRPRRWRGREPYMLIQGFARLTSRKNRSRAWRLGKSNRRRSPVLFFTRTCTLGRELILSISAHSRRARHKTTKGKPGIDRLGKLIDFLLTRMPRASATKACIAYIMRSKRKRLSNGLVRTNSSARQALVKISQAAHMGKDRIFASRESVVWV